MTTRVCAKQIRCRHRGTPISLDKFRKGDTKPQCYLYHKTCNDCRTTRNHVATAYVLPSHFSPPSPLTAQRNKCRHCKRSWSLPRFRDSLGRQGMTCTFCQPENDGWTDLALLLIHKTLHKLPIRTKANIFTILLRLIHQTLMKL